MKKIKPFFWTVDIAFIFYWAATVFHLFPPEYLFQDYYNPISVAWNWSFFPLDMCISATGLLSLWLYSRENPAWTRLSLISLVLTFCSGLMAISFWAIRLDFDILWWAPNLFLLIYPLFFLKNYLSSPPVRK
jgi:hypothetical protein